MKQRIKCWGIILYLGFTFSLNANAKIHSMFYYKFKNRAQCWLALKELEKESGEDFLKMSMELYNKYRIFLTLFCDYSEDDKVWDDMKLDYHLHALLTNIYPYVDEMAYTNFLEKYQQEIETQALVVNITKSVNKSHSVNTNDSDSESNSGDESDLELCAKAESAKQNPTTSESFIDRIAKKLRY